MRDDAFNLAEYVLRTGRNSPEKTALEVVSEGGSERWSYARLIAAVRGTAFGLLDLGFRPGDILLMRLGNTPDFPICYLGALAAGLVPVPTAAALTESEVAGLIKRLSPVAVLHDPGVSCPQVARSVSVSTLRDMRSLPAADWHRGDAERLGYIIFTSGTSGTPTAVMHAHRAILARRMMIEGWAAMGHDDRVMHAGAFNWTYTLGTGLMDPWTVGATAVIPVPGTQSTALPELIAASRASIFAAAPGVYRQLLRAQAIPDMPDLRHGLSAGEKLSETLRQSWQEATGTEIFEAYGMSECSTFISGAPQAPAKPGALGSPQPGRKVQILTPNGPAATGTPGTIAIHRSDPGLMLGYLDAPHQTEARMQGEWFLTGDQGIMDADGQITYLGRDDDMMNAGGFRVSPLEVEATLAQMAGIDAVGVTEIEVKDGVSVIAAFYTGAKALDNAALEAFAKTRLARYKQPRLYIHLPALPTGANGKLQRRALHSIYEDLK